MSEPKFQVGDRVRVTNPKSLLFSDHCVIKEIVRASNEMSLFVWQESGLSSDWLKEVDMELAEPAPAVDEPKATRSKLRFGDKVKVLESGHDWNGRICLVASVEEDKGKVWVYESHDTSVSAFVRINELELIERDAFSKPDNVNHPPHYNQGGIECIEAIKAALGSGFVSYLRGNVLKYLWRCEHKGGIEDLRKAAFYLDRAIKEMEVSGE
jgi:hypothetical protein